MKTSKHNGVPGSVPGSGLAGLTGKNVRASAARALADVVHLDPVIHERTRLSILTTLYTLGEGGCSFPDLRDTLSLTDGNLMAHLRTLELAHLVERVKAGAGRNSSTTVRLSASGRRDFQNYLAQLEMLVQTARAGRTD